MYIIFARISNIFELNLRGETSQRGNLWSENTTVHCVQRSQYLKGHRETICGWRLFASLFHVSVMMINALNI